VELVRQVSDTIYRGPRPTGDVDMACCGNVKGIQRIVNLQGFVVEYMQVEAERKQVYAAGGIEFIHLPWNLLTPPTRDEVNPSANHHGCGTDKSLRPLP